MRFRPLLPFLLFASILGYAPHAWAGDYDEYPSLPSFGSDRPAAPAPPRPPEPPSARFGAPGQVVISGSSNVGISSSQYDSGSASSFGLTFDPSVDVFIVRNVSIGLGTDVSYSNQKGYGADGSLVQTRVTGVSIGPRLGLNVPLGRAASLWPTLTFAIESEHRNESVLSGTSATVAGSSVVASAPTVVGPSLNLYVPILFHPGPHVFIGAGPYFYREFGNVQNGPNVGDQRTTIGGGLVVGGYFGGTAEPVDAPATPRASRRFGEAGELVFTNEETLDGSYTWYAGSAASLTSMSVQLGIDYFVVDHVSLGGFGFASYSNQVGYDPTGATVTQVTTGGGGGVRVGGDIPLARYLSLYPRASVGFGPSSYDEKSGMTENDPSEITAWVSLSVPLLVHATSHFFVGFGPDVSHDLVAKFTYPNGASNEVRLTRVGAELTVGAWL